MIYSVVINNNKNTIYAKQENGIDIDDIEGLVIWYLNSQPTLADYRSSFGFRGDYTGLGLYVFKHEKQWRILGIYNQGLAGMSVANAVANLSKYLIHSFSFDFLIQLNLTIPVSCMILTADPSISNIELTNRSSLWSTALIMERNINHALRAKAIMDFIKRVM